MRSRKLITALLSVALAVSFLSGCGQNQAQKGKINAAYFYGETVWPSKYSDSNKDVAPSEASVLVNGITYTGAYDFTVDYFPFPRPDVLHYYEGDGFSFAISPHDGKCYSFTLDRPKADVCTFDAIRGREIADAFADNYISVDEYVDEYKVTEGANPSRHRHEYTYYRNIDGIRTTDQLNVALNCDGSLVGFGCWQLGAFENVKSVAIDEEKVKAAIEERCREYYTDEKRDFTSCEIIDPELLLVKTEANQCALIFTVSARFRYKNSEHDTGDWLQQMLVIVDYEKYDWFKP